MASNARMVSGPTVRDTRVVERVGANADVEEAERFGPGERQRQEHRVRAGT